MLSKLKTQNPETMKLDEFCALKTKKEHKKLLSIRKKLRGITKRTQKNKRLEKRVDCLFDILTVTKNIKNIITIISLENKSIQ